MLLVGELLRLHFSCEDILPLLTAPFTWTAWERFVRQAHVVFGLPLVAGTFLAYSTAVSAAFGPDWCQLAVDSTDFSSLWQLCLQTFHYDLLPGSPDQIAACHRMLAVVPPFSYNFWQSFYHEVCRQQRGILPVLSSTQVSRMVWAHYGSRASQLVDSIPCAQRAAALQHVLQLPRPVRFRVRAERRMRAATVRCVASRITEALDAVVTSLPSSVPLADQRRLRAVLRSLRQFTARLPARRAVVSPASLANLRPGRPRR